ncbi:hypothetical protein N7470_010376 [Penicillium chermesinum]|nr:hypothetical protein N7470_010376 [Penicillium chermesinum]
MSTRSHQGCWTCKRKRRRCDNAQPHCDNCVRRGIECEGYEVRLRWGSGIASRGRFAGADKPLEDSVPSRPKGRKRDLRKEKRPEKLVSHESHDLRDERRPSRPNESSEGVYQGTGGPAVPEDSSSQPRRSKTDEALFSKFMNSGINVLHSTTAGDDLLQPRLPELCCESSALYTICLAFQLSLETVQSPQFFEYFDKSLREFRAELDRSTTLPDGTLLAGLLLSSIGLMHGLPWTIHLEGMHNILQSHDLADQHYVARSNSFRAHLFEVMGVMDLPHFRTLLDLYAGIGTSTTEQSLWDWPGEAGSFLQCYLWEAHRLAGILALRRGNRKRQQNSPTEPSIATWRQSRECPASETVLVARILANLDALRLACMERPSEDKFIRNAILFPVFHAGLEVSVLSQNPKWKETIQNCLLGSPQDAILLSQEGWKWGCYDAFGEQTEFTFQTYMNELLISVYYAR